MQFRLTYSGLLNSTGNDSKGNKRADHKHEIRSGFSPQLKRLWEITPYLKNAERSGPSPLLLSGDESGGDVPKYKSTWLAKKHGKYGWGFVPLVTKELDLMCSVDVLFLRPQRPGGVIEQGDIDGRLKTLLDALAIPDGNQGYIHREPWKKPMFTLLEDDRLVTKVSVETDQLLELDGSNYNSNFVRLVITVSIRPYEMHLGNMQFG